MSSCLEGVGVWGVGPSGPDLGPGFLTFESVELVSPDPGVPVGRMLLVSARVRYVAC